MADRQPDYELEAAELELRLYDLVGNVKKMEFRKRQLAADIAKQNSNIEATKAAIADLEAQISQLTETHGKDS